MVVNANTVYSSQGLTIGTGVVDLKVGRNTDATTLYMAISRFRRADHLLILQPFDIDVLQRPLGVRVTSTRSPIPDLQPPRPIPAPTENPKEKSFWTPGSSERTAPAAH